MTYIVNEKCIKCKYTDCVEVCPVDCFYEGENMLVIHPDECIDCGVCEPECPVDAIKPDTEPGLEKWLELNRKFSESWPNITSKKDALPDAEPIRTRRTSSTSIFRPSRGPETRAGRALNAALRQNAQPFRTLFRMLTIRARPVRAPIPCRRAALHFQ